MNDGLKIPREGELDFLSLGALVHRLDPGIVPFRKATECQIHVSGGEFNVAANLADCFRLQTGIASAIVDYPIGDLVGERVRAMGVKPFYKHFPHDGVTGPNIATVYSDRGHGVRAPVVFYNRSNEAASRLKPGGRLVGAVVKDHGGADAVPAIAVNSGDIRSSDAVVWKVLVKRLHPHRPHPLAHQIADGIIDNGAGNARLQPKAIGQIGGDIEFAAADVDLAFRRLAEGDDAGVEPVNKGAQGKE